MKSLKSYVTESNQIINLIEKKNDKKDYFFSNIIFFTNERNSKKNKTLKNLEEAIKGTDINLIVFVADEVTYEATDKQIKIWDSEENLTIKDESNIDTIVIARLGVQECEMCCECIKELQEWGFYVLNPIQAGKKACNKYQSAVLGQRYKIPQPKFTLLGKDDVKDGMKSLQKKLKLIYKDFKENDKSQEYVLKLLQGHGGSGCVLCNNKNILSILQAYFVIDPELELLIQKKEEADGGDIRVHVITNRTNQKIIGAMKRVKISGDFRSNVSLGASTEPVTLTKEQEEIALRVAKISGMPWCAVDIMPLVKGSNPEIGDNVVLEWNASPGSSGISEVIKENFMKILLDAINDISEIVIQPKSIGYIEDMDFFIGNDKITLEAKFDTGNGAYSSTLGCDALSIDGDDVYATIEGTEYKFKLHGKSHPIVGQVREERITVLIPEIKIGTRRYINAEFALVDNREKSTKVLINRDLMSKMGYMINPSKKHSLKGELN